MIRLSRKSLLALEAVLDVALHARPNPVQARDITARQGVPQRYLEQVMQALVRAGILRGVRGPRGARHGLRHGHSIITALALDLGRRRRRQRRPRREPRRLVRRARQRCVGGGARFRRRRGARVVARRQRRPGSPGSALRRRGQHFGRGSDGHFAPACQNPKPTETSAFSGRTEISLRQLHAVDATRRRSQRCGCQTARRG